jgi:WD40 repeat protein
MPPGKRDKMKPEEIALVKAWIDAGAHGPLVADDKPRMPREIVTPKIVPKVATPTAIQAIAFSSKAKVIAEGKYAAVELVDAGTRALVRKLTGIKGKVNSVAFSPDGMTIYAAGGEPGLGGSVIAWKVNDGAIVRTFVGHLDACYAIALSPDGKLLATGSYDQKIKLWDTATGKELATLKGHNGAINSLAFRPDGMVLASASADRTIKLWSVPAGERLDTFSQPTKEQTAVVFSADGKRLFAGGADNRIRAWSISTHAKEGSNAILTSRFAHEGGLLSLAASSDGKLLASAANDATIKIWNLADLTENILLDKQADWAPALAFTDKGELVVGRLNGSLDVYSTKDGKPVAAAKPMPPAKPELIRLEPPAAVSMGSNTITVVGKNLKGAGVSARTSHPGLMAEIVAGSAAKTSAKLRFTASSRVPRGAYDVWLSSAGGSSAKLKVYVDDPPPTATTAATFAQGPMLLSALPASLWGILTEIGQHDAYRWHAKAGEECIFDLAVDQIQSKAKAPALEIVDANGTILAANRGLDSGSDPFLAWTAPAEGDYIVRVSNTTMDGSPAHHYRLTMGALPYATAWFPLSAEAGRDTQVRLIGHHLEGMPPIVVKAPAAGTASIPLPPEVRSRRAPQLMVRPNGHLDEAEPNDKLSQAQLLTPPITVNGVLAKNTDGDHFAFDAKAGQQWAIETVAAMAGSPADTKIELLRPDGQPVPRLLLQSVRNSYNNFRSVDANNQDIRLQNWEEMELNEYVYFNGDVMRIFRMPRGPDGGVFFYSSNGMRQAYFDTSATAHTLDEPCYVVEPKPLGTHLVPNGLPVFTLTYANDDSADRKRGRDSSLLFTAPADGRYIVRVTDTRGLGGPRFVYALNVRPVAPDFGIDLAGVNPTVGPGASVGFSLKADRKDGFEGPIRVDIAGVPEGYFVSTPLVLEAGHSLASGSLHASPTAKAEADWSKVTLTATAMVNGHEVKHSINSFGKVTLGSAPKFILVLEPDNNGKPVMRLVADETKPLELVIAPGQTVKAWLRAVRMGSDSLINLDVHNLPHGVIIDDIGLNGVQIREKETERPFFFRAAKWVQDQDRLCHAAVSSARAEADSSGLQTSFPILLKVRKEVTVSAK